MYGVLKQSKNKDLAIEFVKYMVKDEVQANVFMATGRLPTTKSALNAFRPSADPATQAYIDILLNSNNLYAMPQWPKNTQKVWTAYGDFLTKLYTTDEPVQGLLDEMQKTAEEAMK
jgi:ABC-type glycerol-3-phosphate transport system substrate-binding protein